MAEGKWVTGLHPGMPVTDAARVVLAARFEVVRHYLPLAVGKPFENVEYVHQLRVGTRRAGAALSIFGACLPKKHLKAAKAALGDIRRAAGDARDWDVFLLALADAQQQATSTDAKPAFDFLLGYALGERSAAQARLVQAAADAGPGFAADTAVLPAHVRDPHGENTPQTFGDLAAGQFGRLLADFTAAVDANPDDPPALHQLRILGKRVRYAAEVFAPCFEPSLKDVLYPAVEALQEALGDTQDAAVGAARLEGLRDRVKQVIPTEWPRLEAGIEGLLHDQQDGIATGRERFRAWRSEWQTLVAEHPPRPLTTTPGPT